MYKRWLSLLLLMSIQVCVPADECKRQPGWCRFAHLYGHIAADQSTQLALLGEVEDFQAQAKARDPGSLVQVKLTSKVGVNLDAYAKHPNTLERLVAYLHSQNTSFWSERAAQQIKLSQLRLTFRPLFLEDRYQLPLPQPGQWQIVIEGNTTRDRSINGHDCIYVRYSCSSYILTDYDSPGISEPRLRRIGGKWVEPITLPIDPYYVLQRTGYACMAEGDYPIPSVHPEKVEWFYDDTCEAEEPYVPSALQGCRTCHCSHTVRTSCVAALKKHVGSLRVSFVFTRLPWNQSFADEIRLRSTPPTTQHPNSADQTMLASDLSSTIVQYKYFSNTSCEIHEPCIGDVGWRRLLLFDSSEQNIGGLPLTVGQIYVLNNNDDQIPAAVANHGLYQYDVCHRHYHFKYYGTFTVGSVNHTNGKRGFCIIATNRQANAEWSPLWSPFYNCSYQGNSAGWTDTYQIGIPCQWVDITTFDTTSSAVRTTLNANMNPDGMLCEGELILNKKGEFIWERTNYTAMNGETVYKPKCRLGTNPSTLANNFEQVPITIPQDGHGYITEPCNPANQHMGAERNCGFKLKSAINECSPGGKVRLRCRLSFKGPKNDTAIPYVVRICESSRVLNTGTVCDYNTVLRNKVVNTSGTHLVRFRCPKYRDERETGGLYSIYTTPLLPQLEHPTTSIICEARS